MSRVKIELKVSSCESMVDMSAASPAAITSAAMASPEIRVRVIGRMRSASLPTRSGKDSLPMTPIATGIKKTTVQIRG